MFLNIKYENIEKAKEMASIRRLKSDLGIKSRKNDESRSDLAIDEAGALAEVIVADITHGFVDMNQYLNGDEHRPDVIIPGVTSIEVKWSFCSNKPRVIFNKPDDFKADFVVLVKPCKNPTMVQIAGVQTREYFSDNFEHWDFGYGDRYCLNEKQLFPMSILLKFILKKRFVYSNYVLNS